MKNKLKFKSAYFTVIALAMLCLLLTNKVIASGEGSSEGKPYDIRIAVASNFYSTLLKIVDSFEKQSTYRVSVSSGSSGILSSQILRGAPFDVFFSADSARVEALVAEGLILESNTAIYAQGRLLLVAKPNSFSKYRGDEVAYKFSAMGNSEKDWCGLSHHNNKPIRIALAKPELAPYGQASMVLMNQYFLEQLKGDNVSLVYGKNVAQVAQYFSQGGVDFAWLSVSMQEQIQSHVNELCVYEPPVEMYPAINQKMVLLKKSNLAALDFWQYMKSAEVKVLIRNAGYFDGVMP